MQRFRRTTTACAVAASLAVGIGSFTALVASGTAQAASGPRDTMATEQVESYLGSYLAGRLARGLSDTRSAVIFYRRALASDPNNREILEHAFLMEATEGNGEQATKLARKLIKIDNTHRLAQLWVGVSEFRRGRYRAADRHFNQAASGPIGELTSAISRAWTAAASGKRSNALRLLTFKRQADWARFYLRYHRALLADVLGRTADADASYASLFELDSRTPRITIAYMRHAMAKGDFPMAERVLAKNLAGSSGQAHPSVDAIARRLAHREKTSLLVTTPTDGLAEVFYGLGDALTSEGGLSLGVIYIQMALYLKPEFPFALAGLASAYETTKQYARAIETYDRIPANTPLRVLIDIRRARNLDALGKVDKAKAILTRLVSDKKVVPPVAPADVDSPRLRALRAAKLPEAPLRFGARGENVRLLQAALQLAVTNRVRVDGAYGAGTVAVVRQFQKQAGIPADGVAGGETLRRLRVALDAATKAEVAQLRSGATNDAPQASMSKATRLGVYEAIANMMRGHKRYQEAVEYYSKIIALVPSPQRRQWTYWYARGTCYERMGAWDKAEPDLLKALELSPDQPLVLNYLGYSWVDQDKNLARGLSLISRAVQLKPDDGYIVDSLGWAYYRLGRFDEAVSHLERAVELKPADPVLNDHLGDALWRVGRHREARFQWELSLTLKPAEKAIDAIRKKIVSGLPGRAAGSPIVLPQSEDKLKPLGKRASTGVEQTPR